MPVGSSQSGTSLFNLSKEEAELAETCPDQVNGVEWKEPPLLRELDAELLQSGKLKLTGTFLSDNYTVIVLVDTVLVALSC